MFLHALLWPKVSMATSLAGDEDCIDPIKCWQSSPVDKQRGLGQLDPGECRWLCESEIIIHPAGHRHAGVIVFTD